MSGLDTLEDGTYTAVIDSIEDGKATVFFEQDGTELASAVLPATDLPTRGRSADSILEIQIENGTIVNWTYDEERTQSRIEQAQDRFDRLSSRPPNDEDS